MEQRLVAILALSILFTTALASCSEAGPPTATPTFEETRAIAKTFLSSAHDIYLDARSVANNPTLFDGDADAAEAVRNARALYRSLRDRIDSLEPPKDEDAEQMVEALDVVVDSMLPFLDAFQGISGEGEGELSDRLQAFFSSASFYARDGLQTFLDGWRQMLERYDIPATEFPPK